MTTTEAYTGLVRRIEDLEQLIDQKLDQVVGPEEAMVILGFKSKQTLYQKTSSGELRHYKQAGRLYFKRSELMEWMTAHPVRSRQEIEAIAANMGGR